MELLPGLSHEVRERTAPEAQAYIGMLEARVESLTSMVDALQKQVHTLQEQLHPTSRNSSRPPSSDPSQPPRARRPRSPRRRGGQPGHRGATRTLIPVEAVDEIVAIKPEQCRHCQGPLSGDDPTPWRH
jgi:transposase